jgi:hypothetical protein
MLELTQEKQVGDRHDCSIMTESRAIVSPP